MDGLQALGIGLVFWIAGVVKGVTGMGLPTVAVSLLGLWMAPAQAATLLVMPALLTNVAQCRGPHTRHLLARLWPAWLAMALVTVLMPEPHAAPSWPDARRWLGGVLITYGALGLWRPVLPDLSRQAPWVSMLAGAATGAATGVVTAATAVFVIPLVPYLQTLKLDKDAMVQALGLSFTIATLALATRLHAAQASLLSGAAAWATAAACLGLWSGARWRSRIGAAGFQRGLFMAFIGLGLANLLGV